MRDLRSSFVWRSRSRWLPGPASCEAPFHCVGVLVTCYMLRSGPLKDHAILLKSGMGRSCRRRTQMPTLTDGSGSSLTHLGKGCGARARS